VSAIQKKYLPESEYNNFDRFGGVEKFISWIVLVSEYTFLLTKHYTVAIVKNDKDELRKIFDMYKKWSIGNIMNKDWQGATILVNPNLDKNNLLFSKERFCTILSLFVSHRFFPMGCKIDNLCTINDGTGPNNTVYGTNLAPNLIVSTSDEHVTAKFWKTTIKD
jgi:hypothetical protein